MGFRKPVWVAMLTRVMFIGCFLHLVNSLWVPELYAAEWIVGPVQSVAISMASLGEGGVWHVTSAFLVKRFNPATD